MGDKMNYTIIEHDDPDQLAKIVSSWRDRPLAKWKLHGPLILSGDERQGITYTQVLVREPENTDAPIAEGAKSMPPSLSAKELLCFEEETEDGSGVPCFHCDLLCDHPLDHREGCPRYILF